MASYTTKDAEIATHHMRFDRRRAVEVVRSFSMVSGLRSTFVILANWLAIVTAIAVAIRCGWWSYPLAFLFIGTRQHLLGVLMHDAAHFLLFKTRALNDLVGDLFVAFPLGFGISLYRHSHFLHHRFNNTDNDPDLAFTRTDPDQQFPRTRLGFWWLIARSALGLNFYPLARFGSRWAPVANLFRPLGPSFPWHVRLRYVAFFAAFYGGMIASEHRISIGILYFTPLFLWANVVNRVRSMAEHIGTENTHELNATRTVVPTWSERIWIAPYGVSYHLEHHLFPSVPGHALPKLHEYLMRDPEFCAKAHVTRSYAGLYRELTHD